MYFILIFYSLLTGCSGLLSDIEATPQVEISSGAIKAVLLLPDSATGYYRGTRFDWSGVVQSLEYKNHSYFGQWFKKYDPKLHDAIVGPVEEFGAVGYDNTGEGGEFLKIGVGMLRKIGNKPYSSFASYDISDMGTWRVKTEKDQVMFVHNLEHNSGYAYTYSKILRLSKGKPELVLDHILKNTGRLSIKTSVYNHNFFLIDNELTGPFIKIKFPFNPNGTGRGLGTFAAINANEINYSRNLADKESLYISELNGYGKDSKDYNFRIENIRTGAGVRITADKPISRLVFWASPTVSCPEPYINIDLEPGQAFSWKISYLFYETAK